MMPNPLFFTAFLRRYFPSFFQHIEKQFLGLVIYIFVENFKRYLLIKKDVSVKRRIEEKFQKYWERNFLWPTRYNW